MLFQLHDRFFLWFLQDGCYGHPWITVGLLFGVLICLPPHRAAARVLRWTTIVLGVTALMFYNAWREAPLLAWFLVAALVYLLARWLLWRLPKLMRGDRLLSWARALLPRAVWVDPLMRAYLSIDPRGAYWFDLARAVRGLPISRTPAERRAGAFSTIELSTWRRRLWQLAFWLVEGRIWIFGRLPGWWHLPPARAKQRSARTPIELDEPHFRHVILQQQRAVEDGMLTAGVGRNFDDYCSRTTVAHQREIERAAALARRFFLLREALAEFSTFRTPWTAADHSLVSSAWYVFLTWRFRRHYDYLLHPARPIDAASSAELGDADTSIAMFEDDAREQAVAGSRDSSLVRASDASAAVIVEQAAGTSASFESAGSLTEEPTRSRDDFAEQPVDHSPAPGAVAEPDDDSDESLFHSLARPTATTAVYSDETDGDNQVFTLPASQASDELDGLRDLQLASRMIEACLGLSGTGSPWARVPRIESLVIPPKTRSAAIMLLMLYVLRTDHGEPATKQQKIDLIERLSDRLESLADDTPESIEARRAFRTMIVEVLWQRNDYTQIVEFLSDRMNLNEVEWRLLADAEVALSAEVAGQEELRDMLRYDAIGHYFLASFRGLWTLGFARKLFGDLRDVTAQTGLLRTHPVEITPSAAAVIATAPPRPKVEFRKVEFDVLFHVRGNVRRQRGSVRIKRNRGRLTLNSTAGAKTELVFRGRDAEMTLSEVDQQAEIQINGKRIGTTAAVSVGDRVGVGAVMLEIVEIDKAVFDD